MNWTCCALLSLFTGCSRSLSTACHLSEGRTGAAGLCFPPSADVFLLLNHNAFRLLRTKRQAAAALSVADKTCFNGARSLGETAGFVLICAAALVRSGWGDRDQSQLLKAHWSFPERQRSEGSNCFHPMASFRQAWNTQNSDVQLNTTWAWEHERRLSWYLGIFYISLMVSPACCPEKSHHIHQNLTIDSKWGKCLQITGRLVCQPVIVLSGFCQ